MASLFDATSFGSMKMKNRLWRSATWENMATERGYLTPQLQQVYEELARGGVGTIITSFSYVRGDEQPVPKMMGIYDDSFIDEYRPFTDRMHELGANIVMQIVYGGSTTTIPAEGRTVWGPSAVEHPLSKVTPQAMTKEEIGELVSDFAQAARRVKAAGFDGVQIHGAHGYLLSQFLTPFFNRREDEYGGSIENRARIIYEVYDAIRAEVGPDYPIFIKMHCTDDMEEGGLTPEDSAVVVKGLEERGIDAIELSGGHRSENADVQPIRPNILKAEKQAYFREPATLVAKAVNVPVVLVGGHRHVEMMEEIMAETPIQHFALCRTLFSEPDLVNKWKDGYRGKPRCISCNKCWGTDFNECVLNKKKAE